MKLSTLASPQVVGKRFRELRLRRRLSQRDLAHPRYDASFVSQIESGRRAPSRDALAYFASRLGVTVEELSAPVTPSLRLELALAADSARSVLESGDLPGAAAGYVLLLRRAEEGDALDVQAEAQLGLGECAERSGDIADAIRRYELARSLAASDLVGIQVQIAQGRAYRAAGDFAYSIDLLTAALETARDHDWVTDAVRAAILLASTYSERGDHHKAKTVLASVDAEAAALKDPRALAGLHWMRARTIAGTGNPEDALRHIELARGIYDQMDATMELSRLDGAKAFHLMEAGRPAEAAEVLGPAIEALEHAGGKLDAAKLMTELARALHATGSNAKAQEVAEKALEILRGMHDPVEEATCSVVLALTLGAEPRALALLERAIAIFQERAADEPLARALQALGEFHVLRGRSDDAIDAFRAALRAATTA